MVAGIFLSFKRDITQDSRPTLLIKFKYSLEDEMILPIYSDRLVIITNDKITFKNYYFPFGAKRVSLSDVDYVEEKRSTIGTGKWRIYGSGDLRTWFPWDWHRPSRDRIFMLYLKNSRRRIGFTVEDSLRVKQFFRDRGLLRESIIS